MTTFTKEQLVERASAVKDRLEWALAAVPGRKDAEMDLHLAEIALASLEAEPVAINDNMAYAFHHALSDSSLGADEVEEIKTGLRAAFANVTAPPAPGVPNDVSGPLAHAYKELTPQIMRNLLGCFERYGTLPGDMVAIQALRIALDGIERAAMLHDAENAESLNSIQTAPALDSLSNNAESLSSNSPVIPDGFCVAAKTSIPVISDGWVAFSEREPENKPGSYEYLVFETLNNGVHHDYWNVPDNGDDCQFTPFWNHYDRHVTHWMPLPAAPQQEVNT
jgi:hypothetical protein